MTEKPDSGSEIRSVPGEIQNAVKKSGALTVILIVLCSVLLLSTAVLAALYLNSTNNDSDSKNRPAVLLTEDVKKTGAPAETVTSTASVSDKADDEYKTRWENDSAQWEKEKEQLESEKELLEKENAQLKKDISGLEAQISDWEEKQKQWDKEKKELENRISLISGTSSSSSKFDSAMTQIVNTILESSAEAEDLGNLIIKVWNNAIFGKSDPESDPFTKDSSGNFVDDFSVALANLNADPDFSARLGALLQTRYAVEDQMKSLSSHPSEKESAFTALRQLYLDYVAFVDLVVNQNGSLNSFSEDFSKLDDQSIKSYRNAVIYTK